jgi:hypothetical protein
MTKSKQAAHVLEHGTVAVSYPTTIEIPASAGNLSPLEVKRLQKTRRGLGVACDGTATQLTSHPDAVSVKVTPDELRTAGRMAEEIDTVIADLEYVLTILKQANLLLDADAHEKLRVVLAAVRAAEKFDPKVTQLFPQLIAYFANAAATATATPPAPAAPAPPTAPVAPAS